MKPVALTIAGSDPSGGAGIQADLKTFHQFGVYGMSVITLLTVQNTTGVRRVRVLDPGIVRDQLEAVLEDIPPAALKLGALGNKEVMAAVARVLSGNKAPLVADPVMISKHGAPLLEKSATHCFIEKILPLTFLTTPNLYEASMLSGVRVFDRKTMEKAARKIFEMGPRAVLIKGGHLGGEACDLLFDGRSVRNYPAKRVPTKNTHGTGCTFSAAITAGLAKKRSLPVSVRSAKDYITRAIRTQPGLGKGQGPVNHHALTRLKTG